MEKISAIVTLVAGAALVGGLAVLAAPAAAADRRPVDPTRLDRNYRPPASSTSGQGQDQDAAAQAGPHANYHADYHLKTGPESAPARADNPREPSDGRQQWPISPERYTRPSGWRR